MVLLNSTTAFLIGGRQEDTFFSPKTYLFNTDDNIQEWVQGPSLNFGREEHRCARIKKDSSSLKFSIIVVGGNNSRSYMSSVEILDEGASEWRNGPDLPFGISNPALIEDPTGGVILVGGQSENNSALQTLFRLPGAGDDAKWIEMPQKLKIGRNRLTSFLVPDDVASCSLM